MISTELARALRASGLVWKPTSGDAFRVDRPGFDDDDVFTVSEMTIEAHAYPTGTILGFNGTTEWALDSLSIADALWLPREDQLRELLRATFRGLTRTETGYRVDVVLAGESRAFHARDAEEAYGRALLALVSLAATPGD